MIDYGNYCDNRVIPDDDPWDSLIRSMPTQAALRMHEKLAALRAELERANRIVAAARRYHERKWPNHDHYESPNECDECIIHMSVLAHDGTPLCGECAQYASDCRGTCHD